MSAVICDWLSWNKNTGKSALAGQENIARSTDVQIAASG
jgi:hypothetical protein